MRHDGIIQEGSVFLPYLVFFVDFLIFWVGEGLISVTLLHLGDTEGTFTLQGSVPRVLAPKHKKHALSSTLSYYY
jgi:hypothetical protein